MAGTGVVSPSNLNARAQSSSGNKNLIINGAMNVAQRGTSQAFAHDGTTNAYLIDRWRFVINSTDELDGTLAQVDEDPLGGGGHALKWTTGTAESAIASDEYGYLTQKIEAQNLQHIQNGNSNAESLTLSFYVKSSITGTFSVGLYKPDNTGRIFNKTYTINSANTWEKKSVTFAGDTSGGGINNDTGEGFWVSWHIFAGSDWKGGGSTSGWTDYANNKWADGQATDAVVTTASATWLMTQCQLEIGQNATTFEHETFDVTLKKCFRYYQKSYEYSADPAGSTGSSHSIVSNSWGDGNASFEGQFVGGPMRAAPTTVLRPRGSTTTGEVNSAGTQRAASVVHESTNSAGYIAVTSGAADNWVAYTFESKAEL